METATGSRYPRRSAACDECKRRKVRCSAEPQCRNYTRDSKQCTYSAPIHRVPALERKVAQYECLLKATRRAWALHLPNVSLEEALDGLDRASPPTPLQASDDQSHCSQSSTHTVQPAHATERPSSVAHVMQLGCIESSDRTALLLSPRNSGAEPGGLFSYLSQMLSLH